MTLSLTLLHLSFPKLSSEPNGEVHNRLTLPVSEGHSAGRSKLCLECPNFSIQESGSAQSRV